MLIAMLSQFFVCFRGCRVGTMSKKANCISYIHKRIIPNYFLHKLWALLLQGRVIINCVNKILIGNTCVDRSWYTDIYT